MGNGKRVREHGDGLTFLKKLANAIYEFLSKNSANTSDNTKAAAKDDSTTGIDDTAIAAFLQASGNKIYGVAIDNEIDDLQENRVKWEDLVKDETRQITCLKLAVRFSAKSATTEDKRILFCKIALVIAPIPLRTFDAYVRNELSKAKDEETLKDDITRLFCNVVDSADTSRIPRMIWVPTLSTASSEYIVSQLTDIDKLPLVHGESGCGKTTAALQVATNFKKKESEQKEGVLQTGTATFNNYIALYFKVARIPDFGDYHDKEDMVIKPTELKKLKLLDKAGWINLNDDNLRQHRKLIIMRVLTKYITDLVTNNLAPERVNDIGVPDRDPFIEQGTHVTIVLDEIGACIPLLHALCANLGDMRKHIAHLLNIKVLKNEKLEQKVKIIAVGTGGYDNRLARSGSHAASCIPILLGGENVRRHAVWNDITKAEEIEDPKFPKSSKDLLIASRIKILLDMINVSRPADTDSETKATPPSTDTTPIIANNWSTLGYALVGNSRMAALVLQHVKRHVENQHAEKDKLPNLFNTELGATQKEKRKQFYIRGFAAPSLPSILCSAILDFKAKNGLSVLNDREIARALAQAAALMHSGCTCELPRVMHQKLVVEWGILTDHAVWQSTVKQGDIFIKTAKETSVTEHLVITDNGPRYRMSPTHAAIFAMLCGCPPEPLEADGSGFELLTAQFVALLLQAACMGFEMRQARCDEYGIKTETEKQQYRNLMTDPTDKPWPDVNGTKALFFRLMQLLEGCGAVTRGVVVRKLSHKWEPNQWQKKFPEVVVCSNLVAACKDQRNIHVLLNGAQASGADLLVVMAPYEAGNASSGETLIENEENASKDQEGRPQGCLISIQCKDRQVSGLLPTDQAYHEMRKMNPRTVGLLEASRALLKTKTKSRADESKRLQDWIAVLEFMQAAENGNVVQMYPGMAGCEDFLLSDLRNYAKFRKLERRYLRAQEVKQSAITAVANAIKQYKANKKNKADKKSIKNARNQVKNAITANQNAGAEVDGKLLAMRTYTRALIDSNTMPKHSRHSCWIFETVASNNSITKGEAACLYNRVTVPVGSNALGPLMAVPRSSVKGQTIYDFPPVVDIS